MHFSRFSVVKLTLYCGRNIFINRTFFTSTELIGAYLIQEV